MRIERLEFRDTVTGWHLEPVTFHPDLTLLVGGSGVGKTRILASLLTLQSLVRSAPPDPAVCGVSWDVRFKVAERSYTWQGEIEHRAAAEEMEEPSPEAAVLAKPRARFLRERVVESGTVLIERDPELLRFKGSATPKLSPHLSAVSLFREEDAVAPIVRGFASLAYLNRESAPTPSRVPWLFGFVRTKFPDLKTIQATSLPLLAKLSAVQESVPATFREVVTRFQDIFPFVEDVRVKHHATRLLTAGELEVEIKERGVGEWIGQDRLSTGMLRTLLHLAAVALWPPDSVLLIDEFENSLGVNCLDEVAQDMLSHSRRLQFIVTSHHPYIINHIPPKNWKIVTRAGSTVKTIDAAEAGIGRSRHEAFLQLINSPAYQNVGAAG
ncbi:MAG: AAA family ATPase [Gemmataceae bacterium]